MDDDLKPCPDRSCLGTAIETISVSHARRACRCFACGLTGPWADGVVNAHRRWNMLPREASDRDTEFKVGDHVFFVAPLLNREAVREPRLCVVRSCLIKGYDSCRMYREMYDLQDLSPGEGTAPFPGSVKFAGFAYVGGACLRKSHGDAVALYRDQLLNYVASGSGDVIMLAGVSDALRREFDRGDVDIIRAR